MKNNKRYYKIGLVQSNTLGEINRKLCENEVVLPLNIL